MKPKAVNTNKVPPGRARISQAMICGDLIFISGMVGREPSTGTTIPGGVSEQTKQTLENIKSVVEAAGSSMSHIAKTTCFLTDMAAFQDFNRVWESYFPENPPARLCVQAQLGPTFLVEIEAIATMPSR